MKYYATNSPQKHTSPSQQLKHLITIPAPDQLRQWGRSNSDKCHSSGTCYGRTSTNAVIRPGVWPAADSLAETAQPFNMQTMPYYSLAGELCSINVTDVRAMSVAEFLVMVKRREGLTDSACNIVYGTTVYTEHDHDRMLAEFVNPVAIHAEVLTIIKVPNIAIAQELLGANYIGLEVYEQLGMSTAEIEAIPLPSLSDAILTEVRRLHELGQRPS